MANEKYLQVPLTLLKLAAKTDRRIRAFLKRNLNSAAEVKDLAKKFESLFEKVMELGDDQLTVSFAEGVEELKGFAGVTDEVEFVEEEISASVESVTEETEEVEGSEIAEEEVPEELTEQESAPVESAGSVDYSTLERQELVELAQKAGKEDAFKYNNNELIEFLEKKDSENAVND